MPSPPENTCRNVPHPNANRLAFAKRPSERPIRAALVAITQHVAIFFNAIDDAVTTRKQVLENPADANLFTLAERPSERPIRPTVVAIPEQVIVRSNSVDYPFSNRVDRSNLWGTGELDKSCVV